MAIGTFTSVAWLVGIGLGIGLLGLGAQIFVFLRRDTFERQRRLRIPIGKIQDVDPTLVGIDPAPPQTVLEGESLPTYLAREIDEELDDAIAGAAEEKAPWIVIVAGNSKVGKSRALFEALRRQAGDSTTKFVAPVSFDAIETMMAPGGLPDLGDRSGVLWLDDLEPFVDQGLTVQTLFAWHERFPRCVVAATYGGKRSTSETGPEGRDLGTVAGDIRRHSREIHLAKTTSGETSSLRSPEVSKEVLTAIERHGLAAYLVAAPELAAKISTRRRTPSDPECPEGIAIIYAAVDWARAGRTDAIPRETLRELWTEYLPPGAHRSDAGFETGLEWALEAVAGSIALLEEASKANAYLPYDYVIGLVAKRPDSEISRQHVWRKAIEGATDAQAFSVGMNAFFRGRFEDAAKAFAIAARSERGVIAALGGVNLGVTLGQLNRSEDELAAYHDVLERFGSDEDPALREQILGALVNKGIALGQMGRDEDAIAAYRQAVGQFGDVEDPALREQVAKALINMGVRLGMLGDHGQEVATYAEAIERFGDAEELPIQRQVSRARFNLGVNLSSSDQHEEAIDIYNEVIEQSTKNDDPALHQNAAKALVSKGISVGKLKGSGPEIAIYDEVIERFDGRADVSLQEPVAKALLYKGITLGETDQSEDAIAVYDVVIERFRDADDQEVRQMVGRALFNRGTRLGALNRPYEELAAYEEVVEFGDAGDPVLSTDMAKALLNKGITLGNLERTDEELAAYEEIIERFGDADDSTLREIVAKALSFKAITFEELERTDEELAAYEEIIERFGDADDSTLRKIVAKALAGKGARLGQIERPKEAFEVFAEFIERYSEAQEPELRSLAKDLMEIQENNPEDADDEIE